MIKNRVEKLEQTMGLGNKVDIAAILGQVRTDMQANGEMRKARGRPDLDLLEDIEAGKARIARDEERVNRPREGLTRLEQGMLDGIERVLRSRKERLREMQSNAASMGL